VEIFAIIFGPNDHFHRRYERYPAMSYQHIIDYLQNVKLKREGEREEKMLDLNLVSLLSKVNKKRKRGSIMS
jgi:hypothetical protein